MFFSLELLENFKGPAKKFEITDVRDNERRLYNYLTFTVPLFTKKDINLFPDSCIAF